MVDNCNRPIYLIQYISSIATVVLYDVVQGVDY